MAPALAVAGRLHLVPSAVHIIPRRLFGGGRSDRTRVRSSWEIAIGELYQSGVSPFISLPPLFLLAWKTEYPIELFILPRLQRAPELLHTRREAFPSSRSSAVLIVAQAAISVDPRRQRETDHKTLNLAFINILQQPQPWPPHPKSTFTT